MHALIAAVLFAQAIGVPPQPSCDGNPSKEHPGYKTQAGWAITAIDAPKELAVEFLCKGSEGLVVLQQVQSRTSDGIPVWKILAEKKIRLAKGEGLLTVSTCKVGGEPSEEVVPLGHYSKEGAAVITRAFRANRAKETFEVITRSSVECEVEGDD
jgi:hypothetical protein